MIAPGLRVLFCGINPGLYSGAVGHHFARPGNRFWKTLHMAGFTDRVLSPFAERELLSFRVGVTNLVDRATAGAGELTREELQGGGKRVRRKVCRYRPAFVAFLGLSSFAVAFGRSRVRVGPQADRICGSVAWVLPNPSGLNAHYQLPALVELFGELRAAAFG